MFQGYLAIELDSQNHPYHHPVDSCLFVLTSGTAKHVFTRQFQMYISMMYIPDRSFNNLFWKVFEFSQAL